MTYVTVADKPQFDTFVNVNKPVASGQLSVAIGHRPLV